MHADIVELRAEEGGHESTQDPSYNNSPELHLVQI